MVYSVDLRKRIVAGVVEQRLSVVGAAQVFGAVERYLRQLREHGDLKACTSPGRPRLLNAGQEELPKNHGDNTTLLAAMSLDEGVFAAMTLTGAVDGAAFEVYVEQVLGPKLRPGQVVIPDRLSVHKSPRVREAIEAKGCELLFLPSYSPDLNPIELAFSKLKTWLRQVQARTRETLDNAIAAALEAITLPDRLVCSCWL